MNGLDIVQHAYESIAKSHPTKDAFQIVDDIEALAERIAVAARKIAASLVEHVQQA